MHIGNRASKPNGDRHGSIRPVSQGALANDRISGVGLGLRTRGRSVAATGEPQEAVAPREVN